MPQLGNMKFPYTPAGKQRYQQIKKQINQKVTRPIGAVRPIQIGKRPSNVKRPSGGAVPPTRKVQSGGRLGQIQNSSMAAQVSKLRSMRGGGQNRRSM